MSRFREGRKSLQFHEQEDFQVGDEVRLAQNLSQDTASTHKPSSPQAQESNPSLIRRPESPYSDNPLSRCVRRDWVLNPKRVLSFGGVEELRATEEFRSLRTRLYRGREDRHLKSLVITSALSGEGRSFIALNLAQVLALQPGCRVLLVDGDLRRPSLHSALGAAPNPGLSEYLLQEATEFDVMQTGPVENLFLIPSGRSVSCPTELSANGRLKTLIDRVEALFDWIIVDSSPASQVLDAQLLANYCDGVLLVVRSNSTPFDVVRKARARFRQEAVVGVVLNQIVERSANQVESNRADVTEPVRELGSTREAYAEES
jgi:protein-tyrosine kinase